MIKTAGLTPNKDIKIKYTGLKKGEKMHENLYSSDEQKLDIGDKGFFLVKSKVPSEGSIKKTLLSLKKSCSYINNNAKKNLFKIIFHKHYPIGSILVTRTDRRISVAIDFQHFHKKLLHIDCIVLWYS